VPAPLPIGAVARRAGVATSAIRYYERIGLLEAPDRAGGRRVYDESVLTRLALIDVAKRAGFTLAETRTLMSGFSDPVPPSDRWREMAAAKLAEVDAIVARAQAMRAVLERGLECRCLRFEDCELVEEPPAAA
jgi:MerR family redox-sensitive transcriptional activator SoxR